MIDRIDDCDLYDAVILLRQKKRDEVNEIERQYLCAVMPEQQREELERLREWLSEIDKRLMLHRLECDTPHA